MSGASAKTDCNDLKKKLDAAYASVGKKPANAGEPVASKLDAVKSAAEKGDPDAMVTLGMLYTIGQGVPKDRARALRHNGDDKKDDSQDSGNAE